MDKNNITIQNEILSLNNQICFSLYVCSKEIIKKYRSFLEPLSLTYTGYIVMLALFEKDNISVKELGNKIFLDSGTLTPLLKKLSVSGYITRTKSEKDEREIIIALTDLGLELKSKLLKIPPQMVSSLNLDKEYGMSLLENLHKMISILTTEN